MTEERQPLLDAAHPPRDYQSRKPSEDMSKEKKIADRNAKKLNVGEEEFSILAYRETTFRKVAFYALSILTLGIFRLVSHWYKEVQVFVRYEECSHEEAGVVLVVDNHDTKTIKRVAVTQQPDGIIRQHHDGTIDKITSFRFFSYRKIKYIWYETEEEWINPADVDSRAPFHMYVKYANDEQGLKQEVILAKRAVYGLNSLAQKLTPLFVILIHEVLTPFYLFQVLSVTLWYVDDYRYYASVIVLITVVSAIISVYQTRIQEKKVHEMIGEVSRVTVLRGGKQIEMNAEDIVPYDQIILPSHSFILPCDALLLNGSVIVNEAMLTGESVPVTKVPLTGADDCGKDVRFSSEKHNRHTLFSGTTLLQTRYYGGKPVRALVVRTAFSTLKGQLVRSIMYPKPMDKQYMNDLMKFIMLLAFIAGMGLVYTIIVMIIEKETIMTIFIRAADVITIVVPPALPAAMSVGIINANMRLRKRNIYCISPSTINACGQINVVCFDKTGTLTEDGLDFNCLRALKSVKGKPEFTEEYEELNPDKMKEEGADVKIINAAATCQSLTRIDGELHGDPLDLILFFKSKWTMEEPVSEVNETQLFDNVQPTILKPPAEHAAHHLADSEYSVIRQFTFSSALQRMSVIVCSPSENTAHEMTIFTKGSPEMIMSLCDPATIPANYAQIVDGYAQRGFRLISVASKKIEMNFAKAVKAPRNMVECDLELLGLIVMENRLKEVTLSVINELFVSNIRTVMVTGDNLLTAMSVARESGIIRPSKKAYLITHDPDAKDHLGRTKLTLTESVSSSSTEVETDSVIRNFNKKLQFQPSRYHFAVAGPTYTVISREYPELIDRLAAVCDVYARMAPEQKAGLIYSLQQIGYKTAMCGDGANDCAALKQADAGISLSDAEASIAAPFTSKTPDIRCVPEVIKEGRCALVTSFSIFKYMAAYSLNEFLTVMLLYSIGGNLSDGQFLYIDFVLITVVALFLGNTGPARTLSSNPPPARLATLCSICSVVGQLLINFLVQFISFLLVRSQSFYSHEVRKPDEEVLTTTFEGTALFMASCMMYLGFAFVYSKGAPHRRLVLTNYALCGVILVIGVVTLVIALIDVSFVNTLMGFKDIPSFEFRLLMIGISFAAAIISIFYEYFFVQGIVATYLERKLRNRRLRKQDPSLPLFERLLSNIGREAKWFESSISSAEISREDEIKTFQIAE